MFIPKSHLQLNDATGNALGIESFGTSFPAPDDSLRKPTFWAKVPRIRVTVEMQVGPEVIRFQTFTVEDATLSGNLHDYEERFLTGELIDPLVEDTAEPSN